MHEKMHYDHVGIKSCVMGDTHTRTVEKIVKAKKVLNMSTNMGVVKGGLNLNTCCLIYWSVVFPTLSFDSEIWVLKDKDIELLRGFQRYAARRLQRLHQRSINSTCMSCLGWLDIIRVINGKKLVFIRSIACMEEHAPIRRIFVERLREFHQDEGNVYDSPVKQILNVVCEANLLDAVQMMFNGRMTSKTGWKKLVWQKMWLLEKTEWAEKARVDKHFDLIKLSVDEPMYSVWWSIADIDHNKMRHCEIMVKLITHSSLLKGDDGRLKREPFVSRTCTLCDLFTLDDAKHMIMQCPVHEDARIIMYNEINERYDLDLGECTLGNLIGKNLTDKTFEEMLPLWYISSYHIYMMYKKTINNRRGIG